MISDAQRENTKLVLKELFSLWDNRSSLYGNVFFGSALAKGYDKKWRNVTSFLSPMHKSEVRSIGLRPVAAPDREGRLYIRSGMYHGEYNCDRNPNAFPDLATVQLKWLEVEREPVEFVNRVWHIRSAVHNRAERRIGRT